LIEHLQAHVTTWQVSGQASAVINLLNVATSVPSIIVVAFFGSASDSVCPSPCLWIEGTQHGVQIGRKTPMFLSLFGNSLQYVGYVFIVFFDLDLRLLYVFATLGSCFGGFSLFLMSLFAA
jgi:hypothetical protein